MTLASLRSIGMANDAIAATLAETSGRKAPSVQRVQDWLSGLRPAPKWTEEAAAAHLCRLWEQERRQFSQDPAGVGRVDAKWAGLIDPILGEMYVVLTMVPREVQVHMRPLKVRIRNVVSERLSIELPGI